MRASTEDIDLVCRAAELLRPANHGFRSPTQLARRLKVVADTLRRAIERLETKRGAKLFTQHLGRMTLTVAGEKFLELAKPLVAFLEPSEDGEAETVVIDLDTRLDTTLLCSVITEFQQAYTPDVGIKLMSADLDPAKANVSSGTTAFGLVAVDSETASVLETLPVIANWSLLVAEGHRLSDVAGPVDHEHLSEADVVVVPNSAAELCSAFLARITKCNRIEVAMVADARSLAVTGIGLGIDFVCSGQPTPPGMVRRPINNLTAFHLALLPPKKLDRLSEPAQFLLDAVRRCFSVSAIESSTPELIVQRDRTVKVVA